MSANNLRNLVKKLIDFDNVRIQFKVEFRNRKNKETYILSENKDGYQLEKKTRNRTSYRLSVKSFEDIRDQENIANKDIEMFSKLFERLKNNQINKISIERLRLRNPILTASIGQSIIANLSKQISSEDKRELYMLWEEGKKNDFKEKFREIVINNIIMQLEDKLESDDLPTPVFPTSVARSEIPNYYISQPKEIYALNTKLKLFSKLANSICGRCGQRIYGLHVPEEGFEIREILRNYIPDFYNVNIRSIAGVGKINLREIGPFEYMFYLLDKVLQEMFRKNYIPDYHTELFVVKRVGRGKKFFSHYIIPNLNEVFFKLYHGDNKYTPRGTSKIKVLISSFLVENWNIDNKLKENNSEIAHTHINRLLYYIFCHRRIDMDSILFLEDLKMKLGDTTPIRYLDEVMLWIKKNKYFNKNFKTTFMVRDMNVERIRSWAWSVANKLIEANGGETKTLERFMMDLRGANLPHEFTNAIANNMTVFEKGGIEVGEIPFDLQYFENVTEFKQAKAIVIATLHNAKIQSGRKTQKEERGE